MDSDRLFADDLTAASRGPRFAGLGVWRRLHTRLAEWLECRRGTSAVEFALIAPTFAFALLATVDLGLGMSERMAMDHALRTGAQSAMADPGTSTVLTAMNTAATMNFGVNTGQGAPAANKLTLSATRFCACPSNLGTQVSCSTICTGSTPTHIFYRMGAVKTYKGWLIPALTFERSSQVQIR